MKIFKSIILLGILTVFSGTAIMGNSIKSITEAIAVGNANSISSHFDRTVEMTVLDEEDTYSKAQALQILKIFFKKNPAKSFSIMHKGTSGGDAEYVIGNLITDKGEFRIYFLLKKIGGTKRITKLQIEENDN